MRPLAKAVTKSLETVRNLIRDQCLRNNIPNSPTLMLDRNDPSTENLYESLKIFDRLFAEFEFLYVSAMVQVKSKQEHEMQEEICVLFSETLQRALRIKLLEQEQIDSFDPGLMFSIPRLAIIAGLVIYERGPLNMDRRKEELSEMFRPFRKLLVKIRDLLRTLNKSELYQLEKLLCTNEEIEYKSHFVPESFGDSDMKKIRSRYAVNSVYNGDNKEDEQEWQNDEEVENMDTVKDPDSDTTSGYLVPNTSFGTLLQSNDAPLAQNFVEAVPENSNKDSEDSGRGTTENTSLDRSPDYQRLKEEVLKNDANWERFKKIIEPSCSTDSPETEPDERPCKTFRPNSHVQSSTSSSSTSPSHSNSNSNYDSFQKSHIYGKKSGRLKYRNTENLLHRLFVCIAGVADQLQTNFAADLRQILRSVFQMNCTPDECESSSNDSEEDGSDAGSQNTQSSTFEYRANENDVLPESGATQNVYFGEEVTPDSNESSGMFDCDERRDDDESNENSFGIGISGRNILLVNSMDGEFSQFVNVGESSTVNDYELTPNDDKFDQITAATATTSHTEDALPLCCNSCNVHSIARRRTVHDPTNHEIILYFCCQSVRFSCIDENQ
jgi:hypothetical protein